MKHYIEGGIEEGREEEEKHVSSYWMTLKKQEKNGN